jgi:hypothetical protein
MRLIICPGGSGLNGNLSGGEIQGQQGQQGLKGPNRHFPDRAIAGSVLVVPIVLVVLVVLAVLGVLAVLDVLGVLVVVFSPQRSCTRFTVENARL